MWLEVRTEAIAGLIAAGQVPVVASIAPDRDGVVHNVNADTAAAALAVALSAERLVVLTDVEGLYRDWPNSTDVITELSASELRELMPTLESGMVPKMEACLRAVEGGLTRATITDGRDPACPAPGDLHQCRHRHHGDPGRPDPARQPSLPTRGGHPAARARQRGVRARSARRTDRRGEIVTATPRTSRDRARSDHHESSSCRARPTRAPSSAVLEGYAHSVMNTFGPPKRVFVRGEGCYVWDADGRRYLDLLAGHRGQCPWPCSPDGALRDHRSDRHPRPRLQFLRHAGPGRAGHHA